jgi:hypothetical protein
MYQIPNILPSAVESSHMLDPVSVTSCLPITSLLTLKGLGKTDKIMLQKVLQQMSRLPLLILKTLPVGDGKDATFLLDGVGPVAVRYVKKMNRNGNIYELRTTPDDPNVSSAVRAFFFLLDSLQEFNKGIYIADSENYKSSSFQGDKNQDTDRKIDNVADIRAEFFGVSTLWRNKEPMFKYLNEEIKY